nr:ISAs1 family transposase [Gammaproteobacteria bacterium]
RGHWQVENNLHWRLDVIFGEDRCLMHSAAAVMAVIKRFCMNLIAVNDPSKEAMKRKVMGCAISDDYREKILFG